MNILPFISLALSLALSAYSSPRRIINGNEITIDQVPYQIALYYDSKFLCGGSLISKSFVLTAAHCVACYFCAKSKYSVKIGTDNSDFEDTSGMKVGVSEIFQHPQSNKVTLDYDFALLKLKEIEDFPENFKFAKLPSLNDNVSDGDEAFISGWGLTEDFGHPLTLRGASVPIVNFEKCQKAYEGFPLTDRMICAGSDTEKIGTCFGDSGGPLVRVSDGIQFGVTSFGEKCASTDYPTVYAKVSSVLAWIYMIANLE